MTDKDPLRKNGCSVQHYDNMKQHIEANSKRHPWYGPCDGLAEGGSCAECNNLITNKDAEIDFVKSLIRRIAAGSANTSSDDHARETVECELGAIPDLVSYRFSKNECELADLRAKLAQQTAINLKQKFVMRPER